MIFILVFLKAFPDAGIVFYALILMLLDVFSIFAKNIEV